MTGVNFRFWSHVERMGKYVAVKVLIRVLCEEI